MSYISCCYHCPPLLEFSRASRSIALACVAVSFIVQTLLTACLKGILALVFNTIIGSICHSRAQTNLVTKRPTTNALPTQ